MNAILLIALVVALTATPAPTQKTYSEYAIIQLRYADGRPVVDVIARAMQKADSGLRVAGECRTESNGACELNYTLVAPVRQDPFLELEGLSFSASFGPDGGTAVFTLLHAPGATLAFIVDAPGADGVALDYNPSGTPQPVWQGMPGIVALQATKVVQEIELPQLVTTSTLQPTQTIQPQQIVGVIPTDAPPVTPPIDDTFPFTLVIVGSVLLLPFMLLLIARLRKTGN